jgi:hypothetical protein
MSLRDYQRGLLAVLAREHDAERGVKAVVRHHLRWVAGHPDLARFLLTGRPPGVAERLEQMNRDVFAAAAEWLEGRGLRRMPPAVFHAVVRPGAGVLPPWLAGRTPTSIATAERSLAEAARGALRVVLPTAR